MASTKPTIFLIQGSFLLPDVYHDLVDGLNAKGYETVHPSLPSITAQNDPAFPTRDLADDAAIVEAELVKLVQEQNKTVVVLVHSYGGLVGCEAIPEDLTSVHRQAKGLEGGVKHLVIYAAFLLGPGQSVLGVWGENPNNDILENGRYVIKNTRQLLFGDLSDADAEKWSKYIVPQSHAVESTVLTRASFMYVPSTYIVCTEDQACPPQFQRMFAEQAKSKILELASDHSPHLSHLDQLLDRIEKSVEEATLSGH